MLVALTGFMGCGKSTVGRLLSEALGCPFIDLDEAIVKKAGRPIPAIFEADGERGFRRLEKQVLEQTVAKYAENTAVLALGGGTVTVPGAVNLLQENTLCIYLKASLETIQGRLEGEKQGRPLAEGWRNAFPNENPSTKKPATSPWKPTASAPRLWWTKSLSIAFETSSG